MTGTNEGGSEPEAASPSPEDVAQRPAAEEPNRYRVELLAAILLGLAATLTAYGAFRASLVSDEVLKGYSDANEAMQNGFDSLSAGDQASNYEQNLFLQWVVQDSAGNEDGANYIIGVMSPEMQAVMDVWANTDDDAITPFEGGYPELGDLQSSVYYAEGNALLEAAADQRADAEYADEKSDIFELSTVLMAVTLFLAGIAALITSRRLSYALLGLGTVVLIAGIGVLIRAQLY